MEMKKKNEITKIADHVIVNYIPIMQCWYHNSKILWAFSETYLSYQEELRMDF